MATAFEDAITAQLARLTAELERRKMEQDRLRPYAVTGSRSGRALAIPEAVTVARLTKAYGRMMGMSVMGWGKLVTSSKLDRLEVNGIGSPDDRVSGAVWEQVWQENSLSMESKLAHRACLQDGRAHATVWPDGDWIMEEGTEDLVAGASGGPRVRLDDSGTMVVEFAEGSRRERVGALRRWIDSNNVEHATLYRREAIYKFQKSPHQHATPNEHRFVVAGAGVWERREVHNEPWPLPNPLGVVPVVELGVNRELAPGSFTICHGEYSNETGLIDRINLLTFLGLAVAVSMSFPLRVVIGDKILRDDDGNALPPFNAYIGGAVQFEDPDTKLAEYKAADRGALSIYDELAQLASATSTPRHYFPTSGAISNVSAETIRAFEGPLHAAINGSHKPSLGEGWEEVLRLGGRMLPEPVLLSQRAELAWADHESRSLAERADAFAKLSGAGLPWAASAELALALGNDAIRRYEVEQAGSALSALITAAGTPAPAPASAPGALGRE